jgi:ATP-dependent DNA helicase RecQ
LIRGRKSRRAKAEPLVASTNDGLLRRLKALRMRLAREDQVPPYVIFSDRSLIDMAARLPLTKWDFGEVHGVGAAKLARFADIFIAEIRAHVAKEGEAN